MLKPNKKKEKKNPPNKKKKKKKKPTKPLRKKRESHFGKTKAQPSIEGRSFPKKK